MSKIRNLAIILSIVVFSFAVGFNTGKREGGLVPDSSSAAILDRTPKNGVDFKLFWEAWDKLSINYVDKTKLDPVKMVQGAIAGMVKSVGDDYTFYLTPEQNKEANKELEGSYTFGGIGAQLGIDEKDKSVVVIAPLRGSPAEKVGVMPGDIILAVDDKDIKGLTLQEVVSKIRGAKGTLVKVTINRENADKPLEFKIVREDILVKSVDLEFRDTTNGKIAVIKVSQFGDKTNEEWDKSVVEINKTPNVKGVILDLRNNPGGYFSSAIYLASEFLEGGIVAKQQNADQSITDYKVMRKGSLLTVPLAVLVNKGSASASEILAGALQEKGRAKLYGETTFGKGSVQEREELPDGSGLHITIAKWLLPSGKWIHGVGLTPDVKVLKDEKILKAICRLKQQ